MRPVIIVDHGGRGYTHGGHDVTDICPGVEAEGDEGGAQHVRPDAEIKATHIGDPVTGPVDLTLGQAFTLQP